MGEKRVLIVDDEEPVRQVIGAELVRNGCEVQTAVSGEDALRLAAQQTPAVALLDVVLPGINGLQLLGRLKQELPECEVIIMTGHHSVDSAIQAIRHGAFDYLEKPFADIHDVWVVVNRALDKHQRTVQERELLDAHRRLAARAEEAKVAGDP